MKILYDPGILDMRNKGNIALFQVAVARLTELWPKASHEVITVAPQVLKLYCPAALPVHPNAPHTQSHALQWETTMSQKAPAWLMRTLFEIREETWARKHLSAHEINWGYPQSSPSKPEENQPVAGRGSSEPEIQPIIQDADLYVATGAQYMSDTCRQDALGVLDRLEIASNCGVPTAMLGQGFGPMRDPELLERARVVLPQVDLIFVRDNLSASFLLNSIKVDASKVIFTGDDAIEMAYRQRAKGLGEAIGLSLRVARYTELADLHLETLRTALLHAASQYQAPMIALPISQSAYEPDERVIESVISTYQPRSFYRSRFGQPVEIIQRAGRCRLVVTGTFHAAVFALAQGIPAICLAKSQMYTEKFLGLADQFGPDCQLLSLDDEHFEKKLMEAVAAAWTMPIEGQQRLLKAAEQQISLGKAAYQKLVDLVSTRHVVERFLS